MSDLASLTVVGNLGSDPELRHTGNNQVCNFSLAVNTGRRVNGAEPKPMWLRAVVWGKQGEVCKKYLSKGQKVALAGTLDERHWTNDKTGETGRSLEITVNHVTFLSPRREGREAEEAPEHAPAPRAQHRDVNADDDIPF